MLDIEFGLDSVGGALVVSERSALLLAVIDRVVCEVVSMTDVLGVGISGRVVE